MKMAKLGWAVESDVYDEGGNYITRLNIVWLLEDIRQAELIKEFEDAILEGPSNLQDTVKFDAVKLSKVFEKLLEFKESIETSIEATKELFKDDKKALKEIEKEEKQFEKYKIISKEILKRNISVIIMKPV